MNDITLKEWQIYHEKLWLSICLLKHFLLNGVI